MAQKKRKKKSSGAGGTLVGRAQRQAEQKYQMNRGSLGTGGYIGLAAACLLLLASFVLSVIQTEFPHKQPLVFFLMGSGCAAIAYLQFRAMRMKKTGKPTRLFWVMLVMAAIYLFAAIYTFFLR